eukprot:SAG31_NODE_173_length_21354_cov_16.826112_15_plen_136_part_00
MTVVTRGASRYLFNRRGEDVRCTVVICKIKYHGRTCGRLNKAEYKNYVQAIGYCAQEGYRLLRPTEGWTDEIYDGETGWKFECETLDCPPDAGVTAQAFMTILYKLCHNGDAQEDLDRCMANCAAKSIFEPAVAA